jgi:hypothetical protein
MILEHKGSANMIHAAKRGFTCPSASLTYWTAICPPDSRGLVRFWDLGM